MKEIFNRRSIRQYLPQPVEKEKLERLLRAAMQAPSAGNQQPWEFIVIENQELLQKLALMSPYAAAIKNAPAVIVMLGNKSKMKFPENWQMDLSAAAQNILLEAVHLDLGAVWLGVAPLEERVHYVEELFKLPENIWPFGVIALGYPAGENKFIDRYDAERVHYNKY